MQLVRSYAKPCGTIFSLSTNLQGLYGIEIFHGVSFEIALLIFYRYDELYLITVISMKRHFITSDRYLRYLIQGFNKIFRSYFSQYSDSNNIIV